MTSVCDVYDGIVSTGYSTQYTDTEIGFITNVGMNLYEEVTSLTYTRWIRRWWNMKSRFRKYTKTNVDHYRNITQI